MTKVTDSRLFLDSSIWLGYFLGNILETKEIIESEKTILFTSIISIHEIYKRLKTLGKTEKDIKREIRFIEENTIIIGINKEIAIRSAENCKKYKLHTIDSLIYSSAVEVKALFITVDNDFKKTPKTRIIKVIK